MFNVQHALNEKTVFTASKDTFYDQWVSNIETVDWSTHKVDSLLQLREDF